MLNSKSIGRVILTGACVLTICLMTSDSASARPNYLSKGFKAEYAKKYEGTDVKLTCAVCHPGKNKKERNNYGAAFGKALGAKKVTDAKKVVEALTKAGKEKSATDGKTFGDLINDGKLPGTKEVAK